MIKCDKCGHEQEEPPTLSKYSTAQMDWMFEAATAECDGLKAEVVRLKAEVEELQFQLKLRKYDDA